MRIACLTSLALACCLAQQAGRDLRVEKDGLPPKPPGGPVAIPRSYAVVIGIGKYASPSVMQLLYSERDAESIYDVLISPEGGNFHAENVHTLVGPKATLAGIRHELEDWLPSVAKDDDRVLVYFAGHGFLAGSKAYLAPYDLDIGNIGQTAYPMDALGSVFANKIKAKWKVLLTDSCHSGAVRLDTDVQAINRSLLDLNRSTFSLTASRDRERSFEGPKWDGGHGVFTYYVVRGMQGSADENGDGRVTADELAEYVRRNVREDTGAQQNPTAEGGSFDPDMLLAYVPSNVKPDAPPPAKFGTLIFEANMDGVELFVDGKSAGIVNKSAPLTLPGLTPGTHVIQGVHLGYEPDGPRDEMVYPGQETTVSLKILIPRRRPKAAVDHFDKGIEFYTKGQEANYQKATSEFQQALAIDPQYSSAALYLGRSYNALFDERQAEKYFRQAIEIDPDYQEARASFGGMLLDTGNYDEAVRQLTVVVQHDPKNAMAWYLLSQTLCRKESYGPAIDAGHKAIQLTPNNAEAHFWLAQSLRMNKAWDPAQTEYQSYLKLSNFDSGAAGKLNYYVLGSLIGFGKKKRASQQDIWRDLRSLAYAGLCDCERRLAQYDASIGDCQRSLGYDSQDPQTHYLLALAYEYKAKATGSVEVAAAALMHFQTMLAINPNLAEADFARKNIQILDAALRAGH